jgi:hypothetical protein
MNKQGAHVSFPTIIYMEQSASTEANSRSDSEEIVRLQWKPEVHYQAYKNQILTPILSQMNPVHVLPPS